MTTIYTKPQIDAMAVKIGVKIKEAKTTVTQEQGQSTTYAVSQKMITDSLSAFGTAAYKNVGAAAGNVMLVGAGGILGSGLDINLATEEMMTTLRATGSTVFRNIANNTSVYKSFGIGFFASVGGNASGYTVSPFGEGVTFFSDRNNAQTTYELWTNKNTTQDANGFLRNSNSIAEAVVADATGNVAVASIQAGVGAPKIAYKVLDVGGTSGSVAHGITNGKQRILNIDYNFIGTGGNRESGNPLRIWSDLEVIMAGTHNAGARLFITYLA